MRFPSFFIFSHLHHQQVDLPASNHILLDYKIHDGRNKTILFTNVFSPPGIVPEPFEYFNKYLLNKQMNLLELRNIITIPSLYYSHAIFHTAKVWNSQNSKLLTAAKEKRIITFSNKYLSICFSYQKFRAIYFPKFIVKQGLEYVFLLLSVAKLRTHILNNQQTILFYSNPTVNEQIFSLS